MNTNSFFAKVCLIFFPFSLSINSFAATTITENCFGPGSSSGGTEPRLVANVPSGYTLRTQALLTNPLPVLSPGLRGATSYKCVADGIGPSIQAPDGNNPCPSSLSVSISSAYFQLSARTYTFPLRGTFDVTSPVKARICGYGTTRTGELLTDRDIFSYSRRLPPLPPKGERWVCATTPRASLFSCISE